MKRITVRFYDDQLCESLQDEWASTFSDHRLSFTSWWEAIGAFIAEDPEPFRLWLTAELAKQQEVSA